MQVIVNLFLNKLSNTKRETEFLIQERNRTVSVKIQFSAWILLPGRKKVSGFPSFQHRDRESNSVHFPIGIKGMTEILEVYGVSNECYQ